MTPPTPSEVLHWRKNQNLTQQQMADLLGVSVRAIQSWETPMNQTAHRDPPPYLHRALRDLERELSIRRSNR